MTGSAKSPGGIRSDIVLTYGTQLLGLAFNVLTSVLIARTLGAEGKGIVYLIQMVATESVGVVSLGIAVSIVYAGAKRDYSLSEIYGGATCLALCIGIPLFTAFLVLAPWAGSALLNSQERGATYLALGAPLALFLLIQRVVLSLYRGANDFRKYNWLTVAYKITYLLALSIALVVLAGGTIHALWAVVGAHALFALYIAVSAYKEFGISFKRIRETTKHLVVFNILGHIGAVLQGLTYRLDVFLIAYFLSTTEVGIYSVAVSIAHMLWYLPDAVGMVLLSRTPGEQIHAANARLKLACQSLVLIIGPIACIVAVMSPYIFPLIFGSEFYSSSLPFVLLLPGIISLSLWKVVVSDMSARGRTEYKLYSAVAGAILTIVLDFILIPSYGIKGAAIASSTAYTATLFVIVILAARETHLRVWELFIPSRNAFEALRREVQDFISPWRVRLYGK